MIIVWISLAVMFCLQKVVRKETSLNGFVDIYLRSFFFLMFACLDFSRHVMTSNPTLSMFKLDLHVRWTYLFKVLFLSLAFGLMTLSVNNTGCLTMCAAPFVMPSVLTVSDKIPRIIWLLLVVISILGLGFVSQGEDYTPVDKNIGLTICNSTAFY